jgi:hypothetical protein
MSAFRPIGMRGMTPDALAGGDCELVSGVVGINTTVGATTITGAQLLAGMVFRSGSTANYTDTLDTAAALLAALGGASAVMQPGIGFTCRLVNTVAFTETITLGAGMVAGSGTVSSVAASSWRDFLFAFTSVQPSITVISNTTNGSAVVTWTLPSGQASLPVGVAPSAVNIMPGATVSGTGITAGTTIVGVTQGLGGTLGITLSANATATGSNVALTFGPTITVHSYGAGTL